MDETNTSIVNLFSKLEDLFCTPTFTTFTKFLIPLISLSTRKEKKTLLPYLYYVH